MKEESCQITDKLERAKFNDQIFVNKEKETSKTFKVSSLHSTVSYISYNIMDVGGAYKILNGLFIHI